VRFVELSCFMIADKVVGVFVRFQARYIRRVASAPRSRELALIRSVEVLITSLRGLETARQYPLGAGIGVATPCTLHQQGSAGRG
jgi:hypothetical protein